MNKIFKSKTKYISMIKKHTTPAIAKIVAPMGSVSEPISNPEDAKPEVKAPL